MRPTGTQDRPPLGNLSAVALREGGFKVSEVDVWIRDGNAADEDKDH